MSKQAARVMLIGALCMPPNPMLPAIPDTNRVLLARSGEGGVSQGSVLVAIVAAGMDWPTMLLGLSMLALLFALSASRRSRERLSRELHSLRSRIAADLHDDLGTSLSQVAIISEVAGQGSSPQSAALEEIAGVSRQMLESLSEIVWALEPSHDRLHDLTERMRWFAGETLSARGISLDFRVSGPGFERGLSTDVRRQVFLIFKECMNNIARHAGAAHATVVLGEERNNLILHMEDDGRGFDSDQSTGGHGLHNMSRRARLLGGELKTHSRLGQGTSLDVRIPIAPPPGRIGRWKIPHEYAGNRRPGRSTMTAKPWPYQL
jgi:signal transduction histidine kinase